MNRSTLPDLSTQRNRTVVRSMAVMSVISGLRRESIRLYPVGNGRLQSFALVLGRFPAGETGGASPWSGVSASSLSRPATQAPPTATATPNRAASVPPTRILRVTPVRSAPGPTTRAGDPSPRLGPFMSSSTPSPTSANRNSSTTRSCPHPLYRPGVWPPRVPTCVA